MAYTLYNNDGSVLVTLSNGQVDTVSTSLDLIGKNLNNYGEYFNNNLLKLLTNFASTNENSPRSPKIGQLWYNKTSGKLVVYNGVSFVSSYGTHVSGTQPLTTSTGDLWYDTVNSQMFIWNGSGYKLIAPSVSGIYGKFGIEPPASAILSAGTNIPQRVGVVYSYGVSAGFVTSNTFTMNTASSVMYLGINSTTNVVNGITLFNDLDVKGDLYLRGNVKTPNTTLSSVYNITPFGDTQDVSASTSTRNSRIINGNNSIRFDLKKIFPVETISTLSQTAYLLGSEVRVLCSFNTTTSVRRFKLEELIPGSPNWEPMNIYYNTWTSINNNIVI
jgi:hypothetical protein